MKEDVCVSSSMSVYVQRSPSGKSFRDNLIMLFPPLPVFLSTTTDSEYCEMHELIAGEQWGRLLKSLFLND